ncbi:MAG: insulinase family protein [Thiotrichaceae bacterium]
MLEKKYKHLLPQSLIAKRFPMGTDVVMDNVLRKEFVDFYTQFYTPEKMTFIVVGDLNITEVEQRILNTFGSIKNPKKAGAPTSIGDISGAKGLQTAVFADKELSSTALSLMSIRKKTREIDTIANRAKKIPLAIAHSIINRRFQKLVKKEASAATSGYISSSVLFREAEVGSLDVTAKDGNWQAAITVLEQELRRAVEHGFTQAEYDEVVAIMINSAKQKVLSVSTRKNANIASLLTLHIHSDYVFSTPEDDFAIFKENLSSLSPAKSHQALVAYWNTQDLHLILSTKEKPQQAEKTLASLYQKSAQVSVAPVEEKDIGEFAYTDFGKAGEVTSIKHIEDLDIHQIQFKNGVKVNYKKTDFDKNKILISASFGTGRLGQPKDKPGIDMLASTVVNGGGFGKHSNDDLLTFISGKNVSVIFGIGEESFSLSGSTTPEDLELELQLMSAMLIDSGFRPEAERLFKATLPILFSQLKHSIQGAKMEMSGWINGGDMRFTFPDIEQVIALTSADVKQWVNPQLKYSALEIGIVGDFDETTLIPLLAKSVGALPKRRSSAKISDAEREITIPKTPVTKIFNYDSKVEKAEVRISWKAEDNTAHRSKLVRISSILAEILGERMRVKLREELGDVYSPGAVSNHSETYKNVGFITAYSSVKPEDLDNVSNVIVELGNSLAKNGASEDELARALKPQINTIRKSKRQNSYWLYTVAARSQTQPYRLDWARELDADYQSITLADINSLARKYLTADRSLRIKIAPQEVK